MQRVASNFSRKLAVSSLRHSLGTRTATPSREPFSSTPSNDLSYPVTNSQNIQTVHGITSPVVAGRTTDEAAEPPEPTSYRDAVIKRLDRVADEGTVEKNAAQKKAAQKKAAQKKTGEQETDSSRQPSDARPSND